MPDTSSLPGRLPDLIAKQPVLLSTAIRVTILVAVAFGFALTEAQIVAIMVAVEAWLAVLQFLLVTPEVTAQARVVEAAQEARRATEDAVRAIGAAEDAAAQEEPAALASGGVVQNPGQSGALHPRIGPK